MKLKTRRQGKFRPALEALLGAQRERVCNDTAQPGAAWLASATTS